MPFEITTTGESSFARGDTHMGYDFGVRQVVVRRACVDLEEARGDVADIVTDHRRAANALISEWREFYQLARKWDGENPLVLTLPNKLVIRARTLTEGALRRWVQDARPQEQVVERSLRWVVDAYNAEQKVDA